MIRKFFYFLAVFFGMLALSATDRIGPFELMKGGQIKVHGLSFQLTNSNSGWSWTAPQTMTVSPDGKPDPAAAGEFRFNGVSRVRSSKFDVTGSVKRLGDKSISISFVVNSEKGIPANEIAVFTRLMHHDFVNSGIEVDGKIVGFPSVFDKKSWFVIAGGKESCLVIPFQKERLVIRGNFRVHLQDNRKFNYDNWSLRLRNAPFSGTFRRKEYHLTMTLEPYCFQTVTLKDAANLGFRDDVAGDGKGGWTDQGPKNDMRSFPVEKRKFANIGFEVTDPAENGGKAVIGLYCDPHASSYPDSVRVAGDGKRGRYLYLLHALGWEPKTSVTVGTLTVVYADGSNSVIDVRSGRDVSDFWGAKRCKNAIAGWRGENASALIGISVSRFPLDNKPVKELVFRASGKGLWLIAGITLTDSAVPMNNEVTVMRANRDWKPLKNNSKMIKPGSVLDFSGLLDAPAGKYGFIKAVNGKFEFEKRPGKPVRFFGGNIAFEVNFMKNESCDKLADVMSKMGYNILRLHHFDHVISKVEGGSSTALNLEQLDRMDYMISTMKKHGIYITLDLYIIRKLAKGEIKEFPEMTPKAEQFKALAFISESAMRSWERFSANLLNHVNPYTGLAWKDDPAIVTISLINEDTIFEEVNNDRQVAALYRAKFAEYIKANKITLTDANRDVQWRIFLSEIYSRGYRRMAGFLRDLGVKALLTDQNRKSTVPLSLLRNEYDFVDNHFYWKHPSFLGRNWRLPLAIRDGSAIASYGSSLAPMFPSRLFGKPFTVSEWDFCYPSEYANEGAFLVGAYSSLQDWDGLCHFTICQSVARVENENSRLGLFDILNDPQRSLAMRSAALFFLRGDVKTAQESYPLLLTPDYLRDGCSINRNPGVIERLGLVGRVGTMVVPKGKVPQLPAGTRAVFGLEKYWKSARLSKRFFVAADTNRTLDELIRSGVVPAGRINLKKEIYNSGTGELSLDRKQNTFKVVTPRSEGFILPQGKRLSGSYATVENKFSYGMFLVAARDDRPLAESRRVLILHLTDSKNSMCRYETNDFTYLYDWGRLPILLKRGEAVISLKAPSGLKLYACRVNGERIGEVPFKRTGDGIRFEARNTAGAEPVLVYELAE